MVSSSTLPAGMIRRADYEIKCKKLYDGDFVIMVDLIPTHWRVLQVLKVDTLNLLLLTHQLTPCFHGAAFGISLYKP